ncbi:MAG: hypothetical protein FI730_00305 [SAR202 cluster bacterium]|nr:hypothetical protein [SAR202 cluster bacterium]MQF92880.1 hypothetical protein [SAR202 cluster bacterium]|tara:strand:+ start:1158 stop:1784 length:627 start_codon:yes stop_codon:yes gene_type:complete
METLIFSIIAFFSGAIPFSIILTKILSGKDVREIGDNNPGAVNAWKSAGAYVGLVVMFLEFLKAILPIAIAIRFFDLNGYNLVFISLMPIFGHSFSPFLKFRGGKALAVTAAMWLALFQFEAAIVIFGLLAVFFAIQKNDAWTVNLVHLCFFIYGITTSISKSYISNSEFIFLWVIATIMMIYNHKKELRELPEIRKNIRNFTGVKFE